VTRARKRHSRTPEPVASKASSGSAFWNNPRVAALPLCALFLLPVTLPALPQGTGNAASSTPTPPPKTDGGLQTRPTGKATEVVEQEPPEEDPDLQPAVYAFNPLEATKNITAGNFYFKKGNFRAASRRFLEATKWDPTSADALLKLGEADEKLRDSTGARDAYTKYLALNPDPKTADIVKKRLAKLPVSRASKTADKADDTSDREKLSPGLPPPNQK
jgi:tetratricopeptide (TPR) repeat protein